MVKFNFKLPKYFNEYKDYINNYYNLNAINEIWKVIQENTDSKMMGRVFSMIHMIRSFVFPLAILIFGPLADLVSIKFLIYLSSIFLSLIAIVKLLDKRFVEMGES